MLTASCPTHPNSVCLWYFACFAGACPATLSGASAARSPLHHYLPVARHARLTPLAAKQSGQPEVGGREHAHPSTSPSAQRAPQQQSHWNPQHARPGPTGPSSGWQDARDRPEAGREQDGDWQDAGGRGASGSLFDGGGSGAIGSLFDRGGRGNPYTGGQRQNSWQGGRERKEQEPRMPQVLFDLLSHLHMTDMPLRTMHASHPILHCPARPSHLCICFAHWPAGAV